MALSEGDKEACFPGTPEKEGCLIRSLIPAPPPGYSRQPSGRPLPFTIFPDFPSDGCSSGPRAPLDDGGRHRHSCLHHLPPPRLRPAAPKPWAPDTGKAAETCLLLLPVLSTLKEPPLTMALEPKRATLWPHLDPLPLVPAAVPALLTRPAVPRLTPLVVAGLAQVVLEVMAAAALTGRERLSLSRQFRLADADGDGEVRIPM